jgi:hypothetical protein
LQESEKFKKIKIFSFLNLKENMPKMSIENCASAFSTHLQYWLDDGNYHYDFNKYVRKNENDVVNVYLEKIKNEKDALKDCGIDEGYIINILKRHFTRKLNEEIEKFMEHKNKNINPHKFIPGTNELQTYEFKILFNAKITKEKIIANLKKDKLGNTIIGTNVEFGKYLPIKLDSVVEDIKNDKNLSNEKIFNLIICLIDINDYYNLNYPCKEKINEILSTSPKETSFVFFSADINEESLTKYVAEKYKTGEYQKYLPLIFNDGRRKSKRRSKKRSKRRSSRRKSKRRSKKRSKRRSKKSKKKY